MKAPKLKKKVKKMLKPYVIDESIERFFPPISRMGASPNQSQWKQTKAVSSQKTAKAPL